MTAIEELPIEKPPMAKGVVRTDAPIDDKAKRYGLTASVTIAADVPHGVHAFRVQTPLGVSNLLRFAVSSLPERSEQEPNGPDSPTEGDAAGRSRRRPRPPPGDVDAYGFQARAGQEMVFQVVARPIGSRLDSVLRIRDAQGAVIAENNDLDLNRDSVLTWRFAEAGSYVITIEDVEHGGAKNGYAYRIYAGVLPFVTGIFPLGVARGAAATMTLTGVNLGRDLLTVRGDPAALVGGTIPVSVSTPAGPALNRKAIALGRYPDVPGARAERHPRRGAAARHSVNRERARVGRPPPAAGSRSSSPDQDLFRFTARKGQALLFDVTAQQLGSPLDSILEVLSADGRPVPRAVLRSAGPDRNRAQRSGFEPPQHSPGRLERDRHQRLSPGRRRAAAGRSHAHSSR